MGSRLGWPAGPQQNKRHSGDLWDSSSTRTTRLHSLWRWTGLQCVMGHHLHIHLLGKRNNTDKINEFLKTSWPRAFHCIGFQEKQHKEGPKHSSPLPSWAFSLQRHSHQQLHCRGMAMDEASCRCTALVPYVCQTHPIRTRIATS